VTGRKGRQSHLPMPGTPSSLQWHRQDRSGILRPHHPRVDGLQLPDHIPPRSRIASGDHRGGAWSPTAATRHAWVMGGHDARGRRHLFRCLRYRTAHRRSRLWTASRFTCAQSADVSGAEACWFVQSPGSRRATSPATSDLLDSGYFICDERSPRFGPPHLRRAISSIRGTSPATSDLLDPGAGKTEESADCSTAPTRLCHRSPGIPSLGPRVRVRGVTALKGLRHALLKWASRNSRGLTTPMPAYPLTASKCLSPLTMILALLASAAAKNMSSSLSVHMIAGLFRPVDR